MSKQTGQLSICKKNVLLYLLDIISHQEELGISYVHTSTSKPLTTVSFQLTSCCLLASFGQPLLCLDVATTVIFTLPGKHCQAWDKEYWHFLQWEMLQVCQSCLEWITSNSTITLKFRSNYPLFLLPGDKAINMSCSTYFKIPYSKSLIYSLRT